MNKVQVRKHAVPSNAGLLGVGRAGKGKQFLKQGRRACGPPHFLTGWHETHART